MTDKTLPTARHFRRRPAAALLLALAAGAAACGHAARPSPLGACSTGSPFAPPLWYADGGRVVGSVRDSAGAEVAPGRVLLTPTTGRGRFVGAGVDPAGTFALDSVAPGRYAAHVVGPAGYAPLDQPVRVLAGRDSVRIVLGRSVACR